MRRRDRKKRPGICTRLWAEPAKTESISSNYEEAYKSVRKGLRDFEVFVEYVRKFLEGTGRQGNL